MYDILAYITKNYIALIYYNSSKFSRDIAWTSNPTCANMTLEIPLQTNIVRQTLFNSDDLFTVPA